MDHRMFDRKNYSQKTMDIYEIMSAYYVDIFYNHLYIESKKLKVSGSVSSITEGYKHTLNAFLKSLSNPKLYKKSISGLHHYFATIGFANISFAKYIDRLTSEFVPSDYFDSLTFTQKVGVLRLIINQSIKNFIKKIVDDHMVKIMDFHADNDNVRLLQDDFIDCLMLEREGLYQRFISSQTRTNKNETVNRIIAEKMQVEIKRLMKEKYEQLKSINILKLAYIKKKENENKLNEIINELRSKLANHESNHESNQETNQETLQKLSYNNLINNQNTECTHKNVQPQLNLLKQQVDTPKQQVDTPKQQVDTSKEVLKQTSQQENFIEVNASNMMDIIECDSDILNNMANNNKYDINMDDGTSLDDFL